MLKCFFIASLPTKAFLGEERLLASMLRVMASFSVKERVFHIEARMLSMGCWLSWVGAREKKALWMMGRN